MSIQARVAIPSMKCKTQRKPQGDLPNHSVFPSLILYSQLHLPQLPKLNPENSGWVPPTEKAGCPLSERQGVSQVLCRPRSKGSSGGGAGCSVLATVPLNRASLWRANTFQALLKTPKHDLASGLRSPSHFSGLSPILEIILIA